jgi:hypothetical protein
MEVLCNVGKRFLSKSIRSEDKGKDKRVHLTHGEYLVKLLKLVISDQVIVCYLLLKEG